MADLATRLAYDTTRTAVATQAALPVATATAARAVAEPAAGSVLVTSGRSSAADGGGGAWVWDATSTDADDGSLTLAVAGVTTGRWKRQYSGPIDVRWFGALGDGTTDDTAAIQAALDSAQSAGGGVVQLARGQLHKVSSGLSVPAGVTLDATDSFVVAATDFHIVTLSGNGARVTGGTYYGAGTAGAKSTDKAAIRASGISDFVISNVSVAKRSDGGTDYGIDIAVQLANCTHGKVDGVFFEGGTFQTNGDGVTFSGCQHVQISRVTCKNLNKVAVYASIASGDTAPGAGGQEQNQAITISDVTVEGRAGAPFSCALQIRACAGATVSNIVARDTVYGALSLQQYVSDGACVIQDVVVSNVVSTNSTHYGFFVSGAALPGQTKRLTFSNVRIESGSTDAGAALPAVLVDSVTEVVVNGMSVTNTTRNCGMQISNTENALVSGFHAYRSQREGLYIVGCSGVAVSGAMVVDSNIAASGYNDIKITGSSRVVVTGFNCVSSGSSAWTPLYIDNSCTGCFVGHGVSAGQTYEAFADNRAVNTGYAPTNNLGYTTGTPSSATPSGYVEAYVNGSRKLIPYCDP